MELPELFAAEKSLVAAGDWTERDPHRQSKWLTYLAALEVDGVTVAGLRLKGTLIQNMPDRAVTFQLEYHRPRQHGAALARVEWKPIQGHNNRNLGPEEHRLIQIAGCHIHPFDLNWEYATKLLKRGNLPLAIPIDPSPESYGDLLEYVGKVFRIKGVEDIPTPPWRADLV